MSDHIATLLEETAELRAAIPGEAPAGSDVSFEPEFEKIKGEVDKLSNLEGGEVDWYLVVERAGDLLKTQTKDLRLAVWLTAGGLQRSGWRGFVRGLVVCRALITDFWEPLLPKRDRARSNIVVWLAEQAIGKVTELPVRLSDGDDVRAAVDLVDEIDG
ncbi:MAG TPA: type VI secretion system ImpA family N-terminal domain-containing protein, partial [Labilithrix sp.]|nr:type VI secretion system ImpA family N-terminal domain-containing protein [Labilithrix sp.]